MIRPPAGGLSLGIRNENPLEFIVSGQASPNRWNNGFSNLPGPFNGSLFARICLRIRDPYMDLGKPSSPIPTPPRLPVGVTDPCNMLAKTTYLIAIGVATCGWLYFIGWIAMHAI